MADQGSFVIPAQAGIHELLGWAGMDGIYQMMFDIEILDSRLRGNDGEF
jgi:hypothetical protein